MTTTCGLDPISKPDAEGRERGLPPSTPILIAAFRRCSPRLNPKPATIAGVAFYAAIAALWLAAMGKAIFGDGLGAWSVGVVYIAYDVGLLAFVAWQARAVWRRDGTHGSTATARRPTVGVIIAAYNERPALASTIDALLRQTDAPDAIWIADDGSDDGSDGVLAERYGLKPPLSGSASAASPVAPALRWLRLDHRGNADALNASLAHATTDIIVTVDADTLLEPDAIAVVRRAFAADESLMVGGGVLKPRCAGGVFGFVLQEFQTYEYVRNFLGRHAWSRLESLLLISGAFAAFRLEAVVEVGGFDPESWVEDYELIHRIHRYAAEHGLPWRVRILGEAVASTDAPARLLPFLRQRRRWFGGFLQAQWWNRDMMGAPRFRALGLAMMPVKAIDTLQPIYGLTAVALLIAFGIAGRGGAFAPALGLMIAKFGLDAANMGLLIAATRRWTGKRLSPSFPRGLVCLVLEPFTFQILRHLGAAWGWLAALNGAAVWERPARAALRLPKDPQGADSALS